MIQTEDDKKMAQLEIKKMKQGMSYSCKEKTIILNVFKYFRTQYPDMCVTEIVRRTAKATGCSEKSVFQFRKEESKGGFKEPSKTKVRKNININSRDIKYDQSVRQAIRNIIYDLQYKNIVPSLATILKHVNADKQLPNFAIMTLRRLMLDMGFSYQKHGNKCTLVERPDTRFVNNVSNVEPQKLMIAPEQMQPQQILGQSNNNNNINNGSVGMSVNNKLPPYIAPDPRMAPMKPPMNMPIQVPPPQHNAPMMPHGEMLHPNNMMKMPIMMNHHREMMPHPMGPPMDIRKREMAPWMHGMIKQGQ